MVVFCHGDKGGVGKSFMAKALIDYCVRHRIPVCPVDADSRNADVHQVVNDIIPVERINLRSEDGWADLVDLVEKRKADANVVISLPAGIGEQDERYGQVFSQAVREIGADVQLFWVMNNESESVKLLRHMLNVKSYSASSVIAVRNCHFTQNGEDFSIWNESNTRESFLKNGGRECDLPALSRRIAEFLVRENKFMSSARNDLRIFDRICFDKWASEFDAAIQSLSLNLVKPVSAA